MTALAIQCYETQQGPVSWRGLRMEDGEDLDEFLVNQVASRLYDKPANVEFEIHLRGLANTGFARDSLHAILAAEVPEERDWAVGEALAEAFLVYQYAIVWPWNMARDKRNPNASLPGADLVGFRIEDDQIRLVLGEVKSSSDANCPPGVMKGRGGMIHQIDHLANNLALICQLLKWLWPRCKGTIHEESFNSAIGLLLNSGNKAISLFGILIRDTQPNEADLKARGRRLAETLESPTDCRLIAIYLPWPIGELPGRVAKGSS